MATTARRAQRRRFAPATIIAGAVGAIALSLSLTGTLAAFTASITNDTNTTSLGTLVMKETNSDGSVTCLSTDGNTNNAATCTTINKYGGQTLVPGGTSTTTVRISNLGTSTPTTFTLTPGACTQSGTAPAGVVAATDLCAQVNVKVYASDTATGTPINGAAGTTLAGWANTAQSLTTLAPNAEQAYTFVVTTPTTLNNSYQNQSVSQPLVWQFS